MKTSILKAGSFTLLFISILMMGFTQAPGHSPETPNAVEFRYMGKFYNGPLFQLNINNAESDAFHISITDAEGIVLYTDNVKGKHISRKYKVALDTEELYESFYVKFEITHIATSEKSVYIVTHKSLMVSDLVVAKLK